MRQLQKEEISKNVAKKKDDRRNAHWVNTEVKQKLFSCGNGGRYHTGAGWGMSGRRRKWRQQIFHPKPFHQEVWLSHPLRMKAIQTEKLPWGEEKFRRAAESYYRESWPGTSKKYNEPGRQPSINGTSLPGWAILSCCHSLNLVGKHQIMVKKEKEKRKQQQQETMRLRGLRERSSDCPWDPGSIWKELWFKGGWKWMSQGIRDLNKDKRRV